MISIVIPAYNEAQCIAAVVKRALDTAQRAQMSSYEVIVVDDGSDDGTGDIAANAGASVVRNITNKGYGYSLKKGISKASYDTIAIFDGDGTYPVEELPQLLGKYQEGYDLVVGQRTGKHFHEGAGKWLLRLILRVMVEFVSRQRIPDINSGFRVFSKKTVLPYCARLCDTFSFSTSQTLAYLMTNRHMVYVPVDYSRRIGCSKVRLLSDSLQTVQFICQAALYYDPLRIFLLLAGGTLAFAFACGLSALIWPRPSLFLLCLGSILVAVLIFALGLLANLLQQIMHKE